MGKRLENKPKGLGLRRSWAIFGWFREAKNYCEHLWTYIKNTDETMAHFSNVCFYLQRLPDIRTALWGGHRGADVLPGWSSPLWLMRSRNLEMEGWPNVGQRDMWNGDINIDILGYKNHWYKIGIQDWENWDIRWGYKPLIWENWDIRTIDGGDSRLI